MKAKLLAKEVKVSHVVRLRGVAWRRHYTRSGLSDSRYDAKFLREHYPNEQVTIERVTVRKIIELIEE